MKTLRAFAVGAILAGMTVACHSSKKVVEIHKKTAKESEPIAVATPESTIKTSNLLDEFANELQATLIEKAEIVRSPEGISISFEPAITFESSDDQLTSVAQENLDKTIKVLGKYAYVDIFVEGHADSSGTQLQNKRLSVARAKNVALYLKSAGVQTERLAIAGYSASKPISSNSTPEGRRRNRRVVIKMKAGEKQFSASSTQLSVGSN